MQRINRGLSMRHATMALTLWAAGMALFLAQPAQAQSFLSRLGQTVSNAVTHRGTSPASPASPGTNDGLHNSNGIIANWDFPKFTPDTLDGYTHLRYGNAALDPFGNGVGGRQVCDPYFVGHNLFHAELSPRLQKYCLGQEQLNDTTATSATIQTRMKALDGLHKFYVRGLVHFYINHGPNGEPVPPGQVLVEWFKNSVPVFPPEGTSYKFVGPNWDTRGIDDTYHFLVSMNLSPTSRVDQLSYVFFTVGTPRQGAIPVTVDKIVAVDDQFTSTLTPTPRDLDAARN